MTDHLKQDFEIDPELKAIWEKNGLPKLFRPRPDKMVESRRLYSKGNVRFMKSPFVEQTLGPRRLWTEEDMTIVVRDRASVTIRIYRPTATDDSRPLMLFAHSGGWCMGGLDSDEFICQLLCMRLGIVVVSVAYRLGPEWSYPTCVWDVYDVMKWVTVNAPSIGGDLSKGFLTGGVSGGGNLTCMSTILARDDDLQPPLTGHLLICTGLPHQYQGKNGHAINLFPDQLANGSWEMYKDGPVGTREMNLFYADLSNCDPHSPLFTALSQTDYSRLGPVFYQVAGMDIWKDSAIFYCDQIRKAGEKVKVEIYPGVPHFWWSMYPQLSINQKWARDLVNGVDWLLKQNVDGRVSSRL